MPVHGGAGKQDRKAFGRSGGSGGGGGGFGGGRVGREYGGSKRGAAANDGGRTADLARQQKKEDPAGGGGGGGGGSQPPPAKWLRLEDMEDMEEDEEEEFEEEGEEGEGRGAEGEEGDEEENVQGWMANMPGGDISTPWVLGVHGSRKTTELMKEDFAAHGCVALKHARAGTCLAYFSSEEKMMTALVSWSPQHVRLSTEPEWSVCLADVNRERLPPQRLLSLVRSACPRAGAYSVYCGLDLAAKRKLGYATICTLRPDGVQILLQMKHLEVDGTRHQFLTVEDFRSRRLRRLYVAPSFRGWTAPIHAQKQAGMRRLASGAWPLNEKSVLAVLEAAGVEGARVMQMTYLKFIVVFASEASAEKAQRQLHRETVEGENVVLVRSWDRPLYRALLMNLPDPVNEEAVTQLLEGVNIELVAIDRRRKRAFVYVPTEEDQEKCGELERDSGGYIKVVLLDRPKGQRRPRGGGGGGTKAAGTNSGRPRPGAGSGEAPRARDRDRRPAQPPPQQPAPDAGPDRRRSPGPDRRRFPDRPRRAPSPDQRPQTFAQRHRPGLGFGQERQRAGRLEARSPDRPPSRFVLQSEPQPQPQPPPQQAAPTPRTRPTRFAPLSPERRPGRFDSRSPPRRLSRFEPRRSPTPPALHRMSPGGRGRSREGSRDRGGPRFDEPRGRPFMEGPEGRFVPHRPFRGREDPEPLPEPHRWGRERSPEPPMRPPVDSPPPARGRYSDEDRPPFRDERPPLPDRFADRLGPPQQGDRFLDRPNYMFPDENGPSRFRERGPSPAPLLQHQPPPQEDFGRGRRDPGMFRDGPRPVMDLDEPPMRDIPSRQRSPPNRRFDDHNRFFNRGGGGFRRPDGPGMDQRPPAFEEDRRLRQRSPSPPLPFRGDRFDGPPPHRGDYPPLDNRRGGPAPFRSDSPRGGPLLDFDRGPPRGFSPLGRSPERGFPGGPRAEPTEGRFCERRPSEGPDQRFRAGRFLDEGFRFEERERRREERERRRERSPPQQRDERGGFFERHRERPARSREHSMENIDQRHRDGKDDSDLRNWLSSRRGFRGGGGHRGAY